jgi:hypothetical protein
MKIGMRAWNANAQRTRRNVLKMGAVFGSAAISGVKSTSGSVTPAPPDAVVQQVETSV